MFSAEDFLRLFKFFFAYNVDHGLSPGVSGLKIVISFSTLFKLVHSMDHWPDLGIENSEAVSTEIVVIQRKCPLASHNLCVRLSHWTHVTGVCLLSQSTSEKHSQGKQPISLCAPRELLKKCICHV